MKKSLCKTGNIQLRTSFSVKFNNKYIFLNSPKNCSMPVKFCEAKVDYKKTYIASNEIRTTEVCRNNEQAPILIHNIINPFTLSRNVP